jgi:hypothetical protein
MDSSASPKTVCLGRVSQKELSRFSKRWRVGSINTKQKHFLRFVAPIHPHFFALEDRERAQVRFSLALLSGEGNYASETC